MKQIKKILLTCIACLGVATVAVGAATIKTVAATETAPIIFSVTDGVKAGDGVIITGANLYGNITVEYRPLSGGKAKTLTAKGDSFGTGVSFVFPHDEENGIYKIKVSGTNGVSNEIIMNAARPLFIDKNEVYSGQVVNIVGRNLLSSEYGYGSEQESYQSLAVKLKNEENEYILTKNNGGILTGVKITIESSVTDEEIKHSNAFKTAIQIPEYAMEGEYSISVSGADGYFVPLDNGQKLNVVSKTEQSWNKTVFRNVSAIGNDPLKIGAAWAQDFNYNSVYTVAANEKTQESAKSLANTLSTQMQRLTTGGGVIYFPAGEYYLSGLNIPDNVILVGAGEEKTKIYRVSGSGGSFINSYRYIKQADGTTITHSSDYVGIANLTISESSISTGYPDYYVNFPEGTKTGIDENGVKRVSSKNKFLINVKVDTFTDKTTVLSGERGRISLNAYKNVVMKNVNVTGGTCISAESYAYVTLENVRFKGTYKASDTPAFQCKYGFIENCYFDLNYSGHGPSVRSDTYIAYTLTEHTGNRDNPTNDGEALLVEMPAGYHATGTISGASKNSITLAYKGTSVKDNGERVSESGIIDENSVPRYNDYAVYILSGKGAGQLRYISGTPVKKDTTAFIYKYNLANYEKNWAVIPDETSTFTLISPVKNLTVYKYKANDCVGTVCLYGNIFDAVVSDCTLNDTAGIYLYESNPGMTSGRHTPNNKVLIQRNSISGVGANYDQGSPKAQGCGGMFIDTQRYADGIKGIGNADVVIRNNTFSDLLPAVSSGGGYNQTGITLITGGKKSDSDYKGDLRYVVIENNTLTGAEKGIYAEARITGLTLRNNKVSDVKSGKEIENFSTDNYLRLTTYTLKNDEETIVKDFWFSESLPTATAYDKSFVGWAATNGIVYTKALVTTPVTLTAKFEAATKLKYASLSLNGKIGLNVAVRISDEVFKNTSTKVTETIDGETSILTDYVKNSDKTYVYTLSFAPKDFDKQATFRVVSDGKTIIETNVSVSDYIDEVVENPDVYEDAYPMVATLKDYCEAAKAYFGGEKVEERNLNLSEKLSAYGDINLKKGKTGLVAYSLILEDCTKIRIYYRGNSSEQCKVNGKIVQSFKIGNSDGRYIEIDNISAFDLSKRYSVAIGDTSLSVSVFDYVKQAAETEKDDNFINMLKTFVLYGESAKAYFGG